MNATSSIDPITLLGSPTLRAPDRSLPASPTGNPLGSMFSNILDEIVQLDNEAATLEKAMYAGQPVELHQVVIAGEKAGIAFELLVEARNRLVEAYQELMRMPV